MQGGQARRLPASITIPIILACLGIGLALLWFLSAPAQPTKPLHHKYAAGGPSRQASLALPIQPREPLDDSGFTLVTEGMPKWDGMSLAAVRDAFHQVGYRLLPRFDRDLAAAGDRPAAQVDAHERKALVYLYEGEPRRAYEEFTLARTAAESDPELAARALSMLMFLQGVAGLRLGESENCVLCRGEGSCIFPISPAAIHKNPEGSRLAVRHFTEYLHRHPDDLAVRWLLNLAYMTLGEYPSQVPPEYLIPLDRFRSEPQYGIGKFREIGDKVGVNRLNMGGGAIMEDFDNDGLLDILVSSHDPEMPLALYHNKGDGTFEEVSKKAGLSDQLGGLYCVQTDYNNDGWMDVFVVRGAWLPWPIRPSLLRNNGDGTFTDVTRQAGLDRPLNAIVAAWADFDNDGHLDLFLGCERGPNLLYHNKGDGTFEEVGAKAGVAGNGQACKGASWGDYDGDGYPDLFVNYLNGPPQLFHNNGDGTFTDVAAELGITAPTEGFACWFFDYDNDGWLDLYAAAYQRGGFDLAHDTLTEVVRSFLGEPIRSQTGRLYRNLSGKKFQDVTAQVGLDLVLVPMGCNFGDFDNDGYLDLYFGTGWPSLSGLRPNRMLRNVAGKHFADITLCSRTGHLQKGHGVAIGDWDRDGSVDLFEQMGGPSPGDRFHNVLFQNPGQGNSWLTVKLIGKKTNRAAIGARLKAVTDGTPPLTVYRHVNSGSSFGANPLQQTLGLAKAKRLVTLEVWWPTSRTTQVFHDVAVNQAIEITEFAADYRRLDWKRVPVPE